MNTNMNFLGIIVNDLPATTRFFTETLGYKLNEAESLDYYSQLQDAGGATIGLFSDYPAAAEQRFDPSLMVDDVDATFAEFKAKGVEMVTEVVDMPFGRTFLFRTPEGHVLRIWKPAAAA